jgi:hypothetical protein
MRLLVILFSKTLFKDQYLSNVEIDLLISMMMLDGIQMSCYFPWYCSSLRVYVRELLKKRSEDESFKKLSRRMKTNAHEIEMEALKYAMTCLEIHRETCPKPNDHLRDEIHETTNNK